MRVAVVVLGIESHRCEQILYRFLDSTLGRYALDAERGAHDLANGVPGIQRRIGILEDHLHVAPQRPQLRILEMADVAPFEGDLPAGRLEQPSQQPGRRTLAASRLTDDRERLSALDREVHPVHRLNGSDLAAQEPGLGSESA